MITYTNANETDKTKKCTKQQQQQQQQQQLWRSLKTKKTKTSDTFTAKQHNTITWTVGWLTCKNALRQRK